MKEAKLSASCLVRGQPAAQGGFPLSHYNIVNNANMIGQRLRLHQKVRGAGPAKLPGTLQGRACWVPPSG